MLFVDHHCDHACHPNIHSIVNACMSVLLWQMMLEDKAAQGRHVLHDNWQATT